MYRVVGDDRVITLRSQASSWRYIIAGHAIADSERITGYPEITDSGALRLVESLLK